ncbi:RNA methyltransferase [Taibaiella lutea]|uniref:RNA methyltransferase n=1 Tax=Taibaiella lutea TaxID=2608001 RepID=A0A5M6CMR7_9BACT|nr:RNA methyltransferase [Taibaiella lutea]KAA5536434.1 RNA methyltransferase [Taibaiella lutea]
MEQAALAKLSAIIPQISAVPGLGHLPEAAVIAAHQQVPLTSIRYNPCKLNFSQPELPAVPWSSYGVYLTERPVFTLDPLFHAGAYYVQEASSMFVEHAFKNTVQRGEVPLRVLDLCAAPGGKSTLLASLLHEEDLLISNEVIQTRASVLAENLTRWGQMNTWVSNNDPKDFAKLPEYFDVMLIDAPCTGSGLWRKDADALDEWSRDHVKLCSERQKRILADALPALKQDGVLLYATCSYSAEENEMVCDWICENMGMESLKIPVETAWNITETVSEKHHAAGYRFYPWQLNGEGFFLAAFRKKEAAEQEEPARKQKKQQQKGGNPKAKDETQRWKAWLNNDFALIEKNEEWYGIHAAHKKDYELLQPLLRIKKTGTALGKIAGKDIIPDHELALSIHLSGDVKRVAADKETALLFLKKEEVLKDNPVKGWQLLTYEGLGLGWGKWLPNRMNNYFPKNWRIRMELR